MPAYNAAPYVGAAIESVLAQTMTDWELLIVDDGSTDATAEVVGRYAASDARIRLFAGPNRGAAAARNTAMAAATGTFFGILDSDDLWTPAYLTTQLARFERSPQVDVITGNGWFLGGESDGRPARPWPDRRPQPTLRSILADEASVFIMSIFRRRVYDAIGGFDETLCTAEDYDFWVRAAAAGFQFLRNDQPLGYYRRHAASLSADDVRMLTGAIRVYQKIRQALAGRPEELRIVDAQIARFETERLAAKARAALGAGQPSSAAGLLAALYARRGGIAVAVASVMARWTPGILRRAYALRRRPARSAP